MAYSVPDCRLVPNASENVNGTLIYDVQTSSNTDALPVVDSRAAGAPVASGTYPQNSRVDPNSQIFRAGRSHRRTFLLSKLYG